MCGICGVFGGKALVSNYVDMLKLLEGVEERGKDASGVGYINKSSKAFFAKEDRPVSEVVGDWLALREPIYQGIAHARKKTVGDEKDKDNNHPIVYDGKLLIHNGSITNANWIEKDIKTKIPGEVDSRLILASIVDNLKDDGYIEAIQKTADDLYGGMACAIIDQDYPARMYLFRRDRPIELAFDKEKNVLYFSSTLQAIYNILGDDDFNGFSRLKRDLYYMTLPDNTGLEIIRYQGGEIKWKEFSIEKPVLIPSASTVEILNRYQGYDPSDDRVVSETMKLHGLDKGGEWGIRQLSVWGFTTEQVIVNHFGVEKMNEAQLREFLKEVTEYVSTSTNPNCRQKFVNIFEIVTKKFLAAPVAMDKIVKV